MRQKNIRKVAQPSEVMRLPTVEYRCFVLITRSRQEPVIRMGMYKSLGARHVCFCAVKCLHVCIREPYFHQYPTAAPPPVSMLGNNFSSSPGSNLQAQSVHGPPLGSIGLQSEAGLHDGVPFDMSDFPQLSTRNSGGMQGTRCCFSGNFNCNGCPHLGDCLTQPLSVTQLTSFGGFSEDLLGAVVVWLTMMFVIFHSCPKKARCWCQHHCSTKSRVQHTERRFSSVAWLQRSPFILNCFGHVLSK